MRSFPYYLAGQPVEANAQLPVTNKYSGEIAYHCALADASAVEKAIDAGRAALDQTRGLPSYTRQAVLRHILMRVDQRREDLARIVAIEAGKPITDARAEVGRMIDTLQIAADESIRIGGEFFPLDISARAKGCEGITRRVPMGLCAFITPFNFPLNLVAHKIGPAIAAGCPFVLKPASTTPISAMVLAEILSETDWPKAAFSVLPCRPQDAQALVTDERIALLSFTGSPQVGWDMKARAGRKKVVLELGGNAACIVDEASDVATVADRLIVGAFYQSGQSCISVQRVLAHRSLYEPMRAALCERADALVAGDPLDERTFLGPLISESDAKRIEEWVGEALRGGAKLLCGGRRNGAFFEPTLIENVDPKMRISCVEAFGPVATLQPFTDFSDALRIANDSSFGLQAGVFTSNLHHAWQAFKELEVGAVIINDTPSFRVDSMPYGGVKQSGLGREGVRYAIEEMTEVRLMVVRS